MNRFLREVASFLELIGLETEEVAAVPGSFVPCVEIQCGRLRFTPDALPSDLLHEAGHVAIMPANFRRMLTGDLDDVVGQVFEDLIRRGLEPDHPMTRALLQCSDTEATAWAWAAGRHLGLPDDQIITDQDYDGSGAEVRACLKMRCYFGINGLQAAGMCAARHYPSMTRWVQPHFIES